MLLMFLKLSTLKNSIWLGIRFFLFMWKEQKEFTEGWRRRAKPYKDRGGWRGDNMGWK